MAWSLTSYSLLAFAAAALSIGVAGLAWRRRSESHALPFVGLTLAFAAWALVYGAQLGFPTATSQLPFQRLGLAIGGTVPTLWFLFALQCAGVDRWLAGRGKLLLAIDPVVFAVLTLTNLTHGLVWRSMEFRPETGAPSVELALALGYFMHILYAYLVVAIGIWLITRVFARSPLLYRKQAGVLMVGAVPPFVANIAFTLGWSPIPGLDLTPFAFTFTGLVGVGLFYFDLLDRAPIARRRAIDTIGDGMLVVDEAGDVINTDTTAEQLSEQSSIVGESVPKRIADSTIESLDGTTRMATVAGTRRVYDLRVSRIDDHRNDPTGHVLVARDITARREHEEARAREHARLTALLENATDAIAAVEFDGDEPVVRRVNHAFEEVFGYDAEAITGESLVDLVVPGEGEVESAGFVRRVLSGQGFEGEVRRETASGRRDFLPRGIPTREEKEVTDGYAVYTDITDRKRREQQVQVLNRILRHNLRNDLNVIRGHVELLIAELTDTELLDSARVIEAKTAGLVSLSETAGQFRTVTRTEITPEPVDVGTVATHVGTAIEQAYPEASVSVRTPDRAVWAAGPPIETALRELCENAIEHNDHERLEVTIAVTQSDEAAEQVTLTVADNGPGVPEYERDVLRAGGETPLRHGSGLGLWVASWIATGLGGELRIVEDTSRGAVIALTFPIRDAPDEESKEGKHRDSVGPKGTS